MQAPLWVQMITTRWWCVCSVHRCSASSIPGRSRVREPRFAVSQPFIYGYGMKSRAPLWHLWGWRPLWRWKASPRGRSHGHPIRPPGAPSLAFSLLPEDPGGWTVAGGGHTSCAVAGDLGRGSLARPLPPHPLTAPKARTGAELASLPGSSSCSRIPDGRDLTTCQLRLCPSPGHSVCPAFDVLEQ